MERFVCTVCGHVYDPEKGESRQNILPNTAFSEVPEDWQCPVCFAGKNDFVRE